MKYTFTLEESDYLTHQLFLSSTSRQSIWRRRRSWLIVTISFALLALIFNLESNFPLRNYFIGASILSFLLYPMYIKWKYKNHFKKQINEHFSKNFGKEASVEFQAERIFTQDEDGSDSRINYTLIESLHELPEHFLVRLSNGQSLILPKHKIQQIDQLRTELAELGKKLGHELTDNTNWKWKQSW